jgi:LSD1 subclass zinc finger protein
VRCSQCQHITPVAAPQPQSHVAAPSRAQLQCAGCQIMLMYPRGAANVQCAVCGVVNSAQQVSSLRIPLHILSDLHVYPPCIPPYFFLSKSVNIVARTGYSVSCRSFSIPRACALQYLHASHTSGDIAYGLEPEAMHSPAFNQYLV